MSENGKIGALDFLEEEAREIEERLEQLLLERDRVSAYIKKLTGAGLPPFKRRDAGVEVPSLSTPTQSPAVPPAVTYIDTPTTQVGTERVYHSRQFNKRLVEEAISIILDSKRPMSTPEIMRTHTMREQVTSEALYRLMYNRVVTGSLMSLDGAFWPEGRPLPEGWSLDRAKRSPQLSSN